MSLHEKIIAGVEREYMCGKRRMTEQERLFFRLGFVFAQRVPNEIFERQGPEAVQALAQDILEANQEFEEGQMHDFHCMFCENCASKTPGEKNEHTN